MEWWQSILAWGALAVVYGAYVPWIARRLSETRDKRDPSRDRFMLLAPISVAAVAVGIAEESWQLGCAFGVFGLSVRYQAAQVTWLLREIRRRRPVKPEDRLRRMEERAARRRTRTHAMERYGPPAQ